MTNESHPMSGLRTVIVMIACLILVVSSQLGLAQLKPSPVQSASPQLTRFSFAEPHLGTLIRFTVYAPDSAIANQAAAKAFAEVRRLDTIFSSYRQDSELVRLHSLYRNQSSKSSPMPISDDFWFVVNRSLDFSRKTNGAFDITVGPYSRVWKRAIRRSELPAPAAIAKVAESVGSEKISLSVPPTKITPPDKAVVSEERAGPMACRVGKGGAEVSRGGDSAAKERQRSRNSSLPIAGDSAVVADRPLITFLAPNMRLDFSAIAKGYIADRALCIFRMHGLSSALVDAGGDLAIGDSPPGQRGWRISLATELTSGDSKRIQKRERQIVTKSEGRDTITDTDLAQQVQQPKPKRDVNVGESATFAICVHNCGVATSGDSYQRVTSKGQRYSHIIDPRSGDSVTHGLTVTVVADDALTADALASACSVLGSNQRFESVVELEGSAAHRLSRENFGASVLFQTDGGELNPIEVAAFCESLAIRSGQK